MTPRVLIPVYSSTWFIELQRVARLCLRSGRYHPVLLFIWNYPQSDRDIRACIAEGMTCLNGFGQPFGTPRPARGWTGRVARNLRLRRVARNLRLRFPLLELKGRLKFATAVVAAVKPAFVVLAGDNPGYDTAVFIRAAHDAGIGSVLVPSTMSNGLEEAEVYSRVSSHIVAGGINSFVAALFPKWLREHNGVRVLRVPGSRALALEWLGLAPPLPWIFNSGAADAIAAESDAMRRYYLACGLPETQLVDTGSLANDTLHEALAAREHRRKALCKELNLPPDRPLLLSALPPDFLYPEVGGRSECEFARYADLVQFWFTALSGLKRFNSVVCLHPSVSPADFKHFDRADVRISAMPTAELIPLCDLYVASVSSTIRWAIACGVPVVNYDVYRYRYTDFIGVPGVLPVEEKSAFAEMLRRFDQDQAYHESVRTAQSQVAADWGRLDGSAGERMLTLFDRIADGNRR